MRYLYKTVSLAGFLSQQKNVRIGAAAGDVEMAKTAASAIEMLINTYAKDGWEYVRSEEFRADYFKSGAALFFDGMFKIMSANPFLQVFVFRQEYTQELEERLNLSVGEDNVERLGGNISQRATQPTDVNASCPNCESLINDASESCWKCKAIFDFSSTWKPIRLK